MEDIQHIIAPNTLNKLFFSGKNINIIQNAIRRNIYDISNKEYLIGNQSHRELSIIMRSIYLQYGKNLKTDITDQITDLNQRVINFSVKSIMTNIKQYVSYKKNIKNLPTPMDLPINMSNRGEKTLNSFQY